MLQGTEHHKEKTLHPALMQFGFLLQQKGSDRTPTNPLLSIPVIMGK